MLITTIAQWERTAITNLMNILPLSRFDIVELSYRAVETRLYMVNILIEAKLIVDAEVGT